MKAAKKREHKKIPAFWKILKDKHEPLLDSTIMYGIKWGEMSIFYSGISVGKSQTVMTMLKNRANESSKETIS